MAAMRKFRFGAKKAGFRRALPCFRRRWPLRQLCPVVQRIPGPTPWRKIGLLRRLGIAGSCGQRHLRVSTPQKIASQFAQRALGHLVDASSLAKYRQTPTNSTNASTSATSFGSRTEFGRISPRRSCCRPPSRLIRIQAIWLDTAQRVKALLIVDVAQRFVFIGFLVEPIFAN
jgi:hypothetical protein